MTEVTAFNFSSLIVKEENCMAKLNVDYHLRSMHKDLFKVYKNTKTIPMSYLLVSLRICFSLTVKVSEGLEPLSKLILLFQFRYLTCTNSVERRVPKEERHLDFNSILMIVVIMHLSTWQRKRLQLSTETPNKIQFFQIFL